MVKNDSKIEVILIIVVLLFELNLILVVIEDIFIIIGILFELSFINFFEILLLIFFFKLFILFDKVMI